MIDITVQLINIGRLITDRLMQHICRECSLYPECSLPSFTLAADACWRLLCHGYVHACEGFYTTLFSDDVKGNYRLLMKIKDLNWFEVYEDFIPSLWLQLVCTAACMKILFLHYDYGYCLLACKKIVSCILTAATVHKQLFTGSEEFFRRIRVFYK